LLLTKPTHPNDTMYFSPKSPTLSYRPSLSSPYHHPLLHIFFIRDLKHFSLPSQFTSDVTITDCIDALYTRFCNNLNPDRSKAILVATYQLSHRYSNLTTLDIAGCHTPLSDHIKLLGVTLDKNLTTDKHISSVSKSVHYHIHICALCHIRSSITQHMAAMVTTALGVRVSITQTLSSVALLRKRFQNAQHLMAHVMLNTYQSIPTHFFSSFTGFPLNTGSTLKLLTLLSILYITHSLYIYIPFLSCAFTLLFVP